MTDFTDFADVTNINNLSSEDTRIQFTAYVNNKSFTVNASIYSKYIESCLQDAFSTNYYISSIQALQNKQKVVAPSKIVRSLPLGNQLLAWTQYVIEKARGNCADRVLFFQLLNICPAKSLDDQIVFTNKAGKVIYKDSVNNFIYTMLLSGMSLSTAEVDVMMRSSKLFGQVGCESKFAKQFADKSDFYLQMLSIMDEKNAKNKKGEFKTLPDHFMIDALNNPQTAFACINSVSWMNWWNKNNVEKGQSVINAVLVSGATPVEKTKLIKQLQPSRTEAQKWLENLPNVPFKQGLFNSLFAVGEGFGLSPKETILAIPDRFQYALNEFGATTLLLKKYLPLFMECGLNPKENLYELLYKSNLNRINGEEYWALYQKLGIIPKEFALSDAQPYLTADNMDELHSVIQSLVLRNAIKDEIGLTDATPSRKRRM